MKSLFAWVYISFCVAWKNLRNTPIQNALVYISFFGARLFLYIYLFSVFEEGLQRCKCFSNNPKSTVAERGHNTCKRRNNCVHRKHLQIQKTPANSENTFIDYTTRALQMPKHMQIQKNTCKFRKTHANSENTCIDFITRANRETNCKL